MTNTEAIAILTELEPLTFYRDIVPMIEKYGY